MTNAEHAEHAENAANAANAANIEPETELRKLAEYVLAEPDALARARRVGDVLAATADLGGRLKEIRRAAVSRLRDEGRTLREIGTELDLSTARVDQVAEGRRA